MPDLIELVAQRIAAVRVIALACASEYTLANAERTNEEGWELQTSGARPDTVVRYENIHLAPDELRQAWQLSEDWLNEELQQDQGVARWG